MKMRFIYIAAILLLSQPAVFGNLAGVQENKLDDLEKAVLQVLEENVALQSKLSHLQEELNEQEQHKQDLMEKIVRLETTVELKQNEMEERLATNSKETDDGAAVEIGQGLNHKRQLNSAWVGFTAVISPADIPNLNPGQHVVFDHVITNMGSSYNETTGKFTAPTKGLYVFNMAVLVEPGEDEYLQFVKDGNHVMYNYAHARGSLHDVSSSRTVVLGLDKGSQVWVQTAPNTHHGSGKIHGNGFSTFSGWLQQMVEDGTVLVGK